MQSQRHKVSLDGAWGRGQGWSSKIHAYVASNESCTCAMILNYLAHHENHYTTATTTPPHHTTLYSIPNHVRTPVTQAQQFESSLQLTAALTLRHRKEATDTHRFQVPAPRASFETPFSQPLPAHLRDVATKLLVRHYGCHAGGAAANKKLTGSTSMTHSSSQLSTSSRMCLRQSACVQFCHR